MKIGVFGGTFNPPHLTHLNIANAAVAQLNLDKLLVFPCGDPPHKICSESAAHRLDMTRLAFADVAHAEVDTFEIDRQGKSYTLDTLRYVREKYPSAQLFLIIGGDSLRDLDGWHCPDEICRIAVLAVACRKDVEKQQSARRAKEKYGAEIVFLDVEPDDASSTEIRLKRQFNLPITEVSPSVLKYIDSNNLYGQYRSMTLKLQGYLKKPRFSHTFYVTLKGLELPRKQCTEQQVFTACALHDCAKYIGSDRYADYGFVNTDNQPLSVVHAFLGAEVAQKDFGITDQLVLDAIRFHTTARPKMTELDMIVYIADKTEKSRPYPTQHLFASTLEQTFLNVMKEAYQVCKDRKMQISPLTQEAIDYYEKLFKEKI